MGMVASDELLQHRKLGAVIGNFSLIWEPPAFLDVDAIPTRFFWHQSPFDLQKGTGLTLECAGTTSVIPVLRQELQHCIHCSVPLILPQDGATFAELWSKSRHLMKFKACPSPPNSSTPHIMLDHIVLMMYTSCILCDPSWTLTWSFKGRAKYRPFGHPQTCASFVHHLSYSTPWSIDFKQHTKIGVQDKSGTL